VTAPSLTTPAPQASLVTIDPSGVQRSIRFQYIPESLRRTLQPNVVGGQPGARSQVVRFAGAAAQTISIECRIAAAPGLDARDPVTETQGIGPQLAALELLASPTTDGVLQAESQLEAGTVEVSGQLAGQLLLVFGTGRVFPVQIQSLTLLEQIYDTTLNPVLATVALELRILTYSDVDATNAAYQQFVSYQRRLEGLRDLVAPAGGGGAP
jgi:hypothetical protein